MNVILDFWNRRWQCVSYDTTKGIAHVRWLSRVPTRTRGFAYRLKGQWFAVWKKDKDHLVFQGKGLTVPMTSDFNCKIIGDNLSRRFIVSSHDGTLLEVVYMSRSHAQDPAYDALDEEMEDFFIWACRLWRDEKWKKNFLKNRSE
jgi:hypothetical protein